MSHHIPELPSLFPQLRVVIPPPTEKQTANTCPSKSQVLQRDQLEVREKPGRTVKGGGADTAQAHVDLNEAPWDPPPCTSQEVWRGDYPHP